MSDKEEKRRSTRRRILKAGKITFRDRTASIDCTVRNLSGFGACLRVASPVGIPEVFELLIEADQKATHCRVEWRSANEVGVSFLQNARHR
jgi:hypothetical protein